MKRYYDKRAFGARKRQNYNKLGMSPKISRMVIGTVEPDRQGW
jgi:hypothetical protein